MNENLFLTVENLKTLLEKGEADLIVSFHGIETTKKVHLADSTEFELRGRVIKSFIHAEIYDKGATVEVMSCNGSGSEIINVLTGERKPIPRDPNAMVYS